VSGFQYPDSLSNFLPITAFDHLVLVTHLHHRRR
jgi:hypothetical protein